MYPIVWLDRVCGWSDHSRIAHILVWSFWDFSVLCFFAVDWLYLTRFWLYYYDWKINNFNKNKKWRMIIDPINESNNWFITNRHKYGNEKYFIKWIMGLSIFSYILSFILWWYIAWAPPIFIFLNALVLCAIAIYLTIEITTECDEDRFGIVNELKFYLIYVILSSISYTAYSIVMYWTNMSDKAILATFDLVTVVLQSALTFSLVIYPKCYDYCTKRRVRKQTGSLLPNGAINDDVEWYKKHIALLSTYDGFEAIMKHLEAEFSMENLLFIQEV